MPKVDLMYDLSTLWQWISWETPSFSSLLRRISQKIDQVGECHCIQDRISQWHTDTSDFIGNQFLVISQHNWSL